MSKYVIKIATVAGLLTLLAATAGAHGGDRELAVRVGPSSIHLSDSHRYDRDYSRYDRYYRHAKKHRKRHHKHHRRSTSAHELWHWYNDGRRDRFYWRDHDRFHANLRYRHHDFHRSGDRYW